MVLVVCGVVWTQGMTWNDQNKPHTHIQKTIDACKYNYLDGVFEEFAR